MSESVLFQTPHEFLKLYKIKLITRINIKMRPRTERLNHQLHGSGGGRCIVAIFLYTSITIPALQHLPIAFPLNHYTLNVFHPSADAP